MRSRLERDTTDLKTRWLLDRRAGRTLLIVLATLAFSALAGIAIFLTNASTLGDVDQAYGTTPDSSRPTPSVPGRSIRDEPNLATTPEFLSTRRARDTIAVPDRAELPGAGRAPLSTAPEQDRARATAIHPRPTTRLRESQSSNHSQPSRVPRFDSRAATVVSTIDPTRDIPVNADSSADDSEPKDPTAESEDPTARLGQPLLSRKIATQFGLQYGYQILEVNGQPVATHREVSNILTDANLPDVITFAVQHPNGGNIEVIEMPIGDIRN